MTAHRIFRPINSDGETMRIESTLLSNVEISPSYWRMRLTATDEFVRQALPGRFVMIQAGKSIDPLLRRPFAVFETGIVFGGSTAYFDILYRVVGKGTALLSTRRENEMLDIFGPLGKGFSLSHAAGEHLLVGGGIGLAPLHALAKKLGGYDLATRLFVGGRGRDDIFCLDEFEMLGVECRIATEDGSLGERGRVTDILIRHLKSTNGNATIYACGPEGMLRAVAKLAAEYRLPCQVSLESRMACGIGVCLSCVVPGRCHSPETPDFRCVCADGPVFDSNELDWEEAR